MKKWSCIYVTILVCLCCLLNGCQQNESDETEPPNSNDPSILIESIPTAEERDEMGLWNIELALWRVEEEGIRFYIYDYDNLGFVIDSETWGLEMYQDGNWMVITEFSEDQSAYEEAYAIPQIGKEYARVAELCWVPPSSRPLEPGRYRATKMLNGRVFSLEFDLKSEDLP